MPVISKDEELKNNIPSTLTEMPKDWEESLAEVVAKFTSEQMEEFNGMIDNEEVVAEVHRVVEPEEEKEEEKKKPILPEQDESKVVPNTKEDPQGAQTQVTDLYDGILDKEEQYLNDHIHEGTFVNKDDVRAVSARYNKTLSDINKNNELSVEQKNAKIADAEALWESEMDSLVAKAEPYNLGEIRKKQFEAGMNGKALEYYHKGADGKLVETRIGRDTTKQYVHDLINTHKERTGEAEKSAKTQESKLTNNAATFVRGDAESMSHGTLYMSLNALVWLAEKAMAQGHQWSAELEEFIAKQRIKVEDKEDKENKPKEENAEQLQESNEQTEEQAEVVENSEETKEEPNGEESKEGAEQSEEKTSEEPQAPVQEAPVQEDVNSVLQSMDEQTSQASKEDSGKDEKAVEADKTADVENEDEFDLIDDEEQDTEISDEEIIADGNGGLGKTTASSSSAKSDKAPSIVPNVTEEIEVDDLTF